MSTFSALQGTVEAAVLAYFGKSAPKSSRRSAKVRTFRLCEPADADMTYNTSAPNKYRFEPSLLLSKRRVPPGTSVEMLTPRMEIMPRVLVEVTPEAGVDLEDYARVRRDERAEKEAAKRDSTVARVVQCRREAVSQVRSGDSGGVGDVG